MRKMTAWLAMLLCALLAVGPALAEGPRTLQEAMEAGREAGMSASMTWHNPPLLDEETNALIAAVLGAMEVRITSCSADQMTGYATTELLISGTQALGMDSVITGDGVYMTSSLDEGVYEAIGYDELEAYYTKLGAYMDKMMQQQAEENGEEPEYPDGYFEELFATMGASFGDTFTTTMGMFDPNEAMPVDEALEASMDSTFESIGLTETRDAFMAWLEADMAGEPYTGEIGSVYEADVATATVYALTRDNLTSLVEAVMDPLSQSETYWTYVASIVQQAGEEVDAETIMAELPELKAQMLEMIATMPDDLVMDVICGYDADGNLTLTQAEFILPGDEDGYGEVVAYAEWQPDGMPVYAEFLVDGDGIALVVEGHEPVAGLEDTGFTAVASIISGGELDGQLILQHSTIANETDSGRVADTTILMGMVAEEEEYGVEILVNQVDNFAAEDIAQKIVVDVNLVANTATIPLLMLNLDIATQASAGAPFDVEKVDLVRPAQMTDEEFDAYMTGKMTSSMQTVFYILSLMPAEVFEMMMSSSSVETGFSQY